MKIILSLLAFCFCLACSSQPVVNRAGASNTVADYRPMAKYNSYQPIYNDTTTANLTTPINYKGIDSCGAIIQTRSPRAFWRRECYPVKHWVRFIDAENYASYIDTAQSQSITNISIVNQVGDVVSIQICTGDGSSCDTITVNTTVIDNAQSVYLLDNNTIVICDSIPVCDTVDIPEQPIFYFGQNGINPVGNGNIFEHGGTLLHNTQLNTGYFNYNVYGYPAYAYPFNVTQDQASGSGSGVASFLHTGVHWLPLIDQYNVVKLGINYTSAEYPDNPSNLPGYFNNKIGYMFGVNATGFGSYGMGIDNPSSKVGGIFIHTLDTTFKDAVTIYGARPPLATTAWNLQPNTMDSTRIAVFKNDKQVQFKGYGAATRIAVPKTISGWDASGNFVEVDTANIGGNVTILNDTTIIICSFGTNLCDTIYTTTGGISAITANNGLTANTSTNVQLGGTFGSPATLLSHRYITNSGFTLTMQESGSNTILSLNNSGSGIGLLSQSGSNTAVWAISGTGTGLVASSGGSGFGVNAQSANSYGLYARSAPSSTNTVFGVGLFERYTTGTAANGIGVSIDLSSQHTTGVDISNQLISKWTTATGATRTSQFIITGVNSGTTADLFTLSGNGATKFNKYGVGSFTSGTPTYLIATDASGNYIEVPSSGLSGGNIITADNGLTANTSTNVRLGGTLLQNTTIDGTSAYRLTLTGARTGSGQTLEVINTSSGQGITSTTGSGTSIYGASTSNYGGIFGSSSGTGLNGYSGSGLAALFDVDNSATNTVIDVVEVRRATTGTAANGIGGSIRYNTETDDGQKYLSNQLISKWTDATNATRTSQFIITGVNSAVTQNLVTIDGNGTSTFLGPSSPTNTVRAINTTGTGVKSETTSGTAVSGVSSTSGIGVYGYSASGVGVQGYSIDYFGGSFAVEPSSTNSNATIVSASRFSSGAPANGIGGSFDFYIEPTTGSTALLSNQIISKYTDATTATRTSSLVFTGQLSASTVNLLTLAGDGSMLMRPITATAASAITPAEGMLIFSSSTNGTFTSIGLWCYENGAWSKK